MGRPRLLVAAVLVLLVAAGCAEQERPRGTAINDPGSQPSASPTASPPGPPAPLVGLASTQQVVDRRAVAVPVQVKIAGVTPAGLEVADLVFLEYAESDSLRFTAVYHSKDAGRVGPVAEIRPTDIRSVTVLNPFVGYNGGTTGFLQQLENSGLPAVSRTDRGDLFPSGYISTANLYKSAPPGGTAPPGIFAFAIPGQSMADSGTRAAKKVTITAPGHTASTWDYDQAGRAWVTRINGATLKMASVVVLKMPYRTLDVRNPSPRTLPSAEVFGEGTTTVVSGPFAVDGKWAKSGVRQVCNISVADGSLLRLQPGATWVVYAPTNASISVS